MGDPRGAMLSDDYFKNFHLCYCETETSSPQMLPRIFGGDHYTIFYVIKGKGNIWFEGRRLTLLAGQGLLFIPGIFWRCQADENDWHCLRIGFSGKQAEIVLKKMNFYEPRRRFFCSRPDCLEKLAKRMLLATRGTWDEILLRQSLFYEFLSVLISDFRVEDYLEGDINLYVAKAVGWIREHYGDPQLRVSDMADHLGISRNYLFTLFKEATGRSPREYMTSFRLSRARELLAGTEYSIEIISNSCGYENPEVFSRAFKKKYGTTPLHYRIGLMEQWKKRRFLTGVRDRVKQINPLRSGRDPAHIHPLCIIGILLQFFYGKLDGAVAAATCGEHSVKALEREVKIDGHAVVDPKGADAAYRVSDPGQGVVRGEHPGFCAKPGFIFVIVDLGVSRGHNQYGIAVHAKGQGLRDPAGLAA